MKFFQKTKYIKKSLNKKSQSELKEFLDHRIITHSFEQFQIDKKILLNENDKIIFKDGEIDYILQQ